MSNTSSSPPKIGCNPRKMILWNPSFSVPFPPKYNMIDLLQI